MQFNIARQFFDGENQQTSQLALLHEPHWVWNSNQHRTSPFKIIVKLSLLQFSSKNTLVLNCPWMKYCGTHWMPLEVKSFPFIFSQKCYSSPLPHPSNYDQTNLKNFSLQLKRSLLKKHTYNLPQETHPNVSSPSKFKHGMSSHLYHNNFYWIYFASKSTSPQAQLWGIYLASKTKCPTSSSEILWFLWIYLDYGIEIKKK